MIKSRRMRWVGHVASMREKKNDYKILVGKPEGKRSPGRPRHTWEDNIKIDLREMGCNSGLDSHGSRLGQMAGSCEDSNESLDAIKGREFN
jgi:hypothetical protein